MATTYKISVPEPCAENWNEMTPTEQGKSCSKCATNVIDFSVMTDQEIVAYLKNNKGKTCGNFEENQLNRILDATTSKPLRNKLTLKIAASLLLASTTQPIFAQINKPHSLSLRKNVDDVELEKIVPKTIPVTKTISGVVLDETTGEAIANATVTVSSKKVIHTQTDENGKFEIEVTFNNEIHKQYLRITDSAETRYIYSRIITLANSEQPFQISITESIATTKIKGMCAGERIVQERKRWWQFWK